MKKLTAFLCSAAMTIGSLVVPGAPAAAVPMPSVKFEVPAANVEQVHYRRLYGPRYYGPRFYRPRFYRRGFYRPYRYRPGIWVPGAFVAGMIVGSAIAAPPYRVYRPHWRYGHRYPCTSWRQDCW